MVFVGIASVIGVGFAFKTITRNTDWKDNFILITKDAATHTQSVRLQNGAADQLVKASETKSLSPEEISSMLDKAEQHCNAIMNIRPVPTAYLTLGNIRIKQKRYEDAIKYYDQVNDLKDIVNLNKALAYRELGRKAGEIEQNITKSQDLLGKSLLSIIEMQRPGTSRVYLMVFWAIIRKPLNTLRKLTNSNQVPNM